MMRAKILHSLALTVVAIASTSLFLIPTLDWGFSDPIGSGKGLIFASAPGILFALWLVLVNRPYFTTTSLVAGFILLQLIWWPAFYVSLATFGIAAPFVGVLSAWVIGKFFGIVGRRPELTLALLGLIGGCMGYLVDHGLGYWTDLGHGYHTWYPVWPYAINIFAWQMGVGICLLAYSTRTATQSDASATARS